MSRLFKALSRKKPNDDDGSHSKLARVLTLLDLTGLGVGSTLGLGAYVLAGSVAYEQAGPGVVISFVIAALAAAIAGLCYAEFAARVPKAGSAYTYTYITIGEFAAFTIGWNLMLEYIIGTASVARGLSGYIDALIDHRMANTLRSMMQIRVGFLSTYPDILSFLFVLAITALLAYGVKESTVLNNIFTGVNLMVIAVVLVSVGFKADPANWRIAAEQIPAEIDAGVGGFLPYGIAGVMAGAAKCFYGYVGFDCIATTGEEARNPARNIPLAIIFSLGIIFLSYFGVATVLTMALPYYLQDPVAPFPNLFDWLGWQEIKWIVSIGAIFSLCTNSLGAMFPLPRILYAMSSDGLLFKKLKNVNPTTRTPILATVISGVVSGTMALLFDLHQLIDMMSIGTLLAYTIVAVSVLVLRYSEDTNFRVESTIQDKSLIMKQLFNLNIAKIPTVLSSKIVKISLVLYSCSSDLCGVYNAGPRPALPVRAISTALDNSDCRCHVNANSDPSDCIATDGGLKYNLQGSTCTFRPDAQHVCQRVSHVPAGRNHMGWILYMAHARIYHLFHLRYPTLGAGLGKSNSVRKSAG
ncbi:cationic amino acid transporter 3-like isoform X2 [Toxorhynchites rutilus septentrionalis]|uniref:cationic amino acid transporter 3-like isoform X2 n=1 Tax=Toxorhynchites rutilus septentrionalis TaxID=329112 RepID=UPI0024788B18|nr:cationic amino acid transporter 3-like isoform X2 [Toxorhynchites rutilus septentrionalis]